MTITSKNIYQYLLATDGVNQPLRPQPALDPANVKIDGRSTTDLLRFIDELAAQVRYYDRNNLPQGDWRPFFELFRNSAGIISESELLSMLAAKKDLSPHLALLLAFLKIYAYAKDDLNTLTKKRLDYYYEEVLRLKRSAPTPDEVHVLFELSKNAQPVLLKPGVLLDAGKTATGLPLRYALQSEQVISHAVVGMIRSSYADFNPTGKRIVFKANDATKVLNNTLTAWRPFGSAQLALPPELRLMEPASFGWAVASPNLLLAEGARTIRMSIQLRSFKGFTSPKLVLTSMLNVALTGEKGWITDNLTLKAELIPGVLVQDPELENPFTLELSADIPESLPAITKYNEAVHQGAYKTQWPVMRVLLKPEIYMMEVLSKLKVEQVGIEVEVKGMKNLILQNDQSVQPSDKPILPFGSMPMVLNNLYIGSQEAFSKTVTSVGVTLEWQDPPESFTDQYANYGNNHIEHSKFSTAMDILSNRNWNTRLVHNEALFNPASTALPQQVGVNRSSFATETINRPFKRDPQLQLSGGFDNMVNQGFIRLVLTGPSRSALENQPVEAPFEAFGHKTFPFAYTQQVILLSKYNNIGPKPELPKPPYTPVLKSVQLNYTAKDVFKPDDPNGMDQYFMQDVFGPGETAKSDTALLIPPQPGNGALYIGLEKALAPQTVSFLFQVEEGSVEGEDLLRTTDLRWSYLAGNRWKSIAPADVQEESTGGFQKPGIVRVNIGADATDDHSLMPAGMRWIRISVDDNPQGAAAFSKIDTQAARAKFVLPDGQAKGYETHLSAPLAPETISKLVVKIPSIKKVMQPFPSFGGHNAEADHAFYRRVSERLRHKNRAAAGWDYERLVLEAYPEIYKVKCLPHSDTDQSLRPGDVRMVVVPDWRKRPTGDPLQPKVNQNRLREISDFISANYVSPFVNVHVSNPSYETLLVDCKVSFHPAFDPGYYTTVLNEEIKKFLSPWAYEEGRDIVFGGKVHASEILAFIEGRVYVDHVTDFELYHRHQGESFLGGGIGDMEIGLDFIIGNTPEPTIGGTIGKTINVDFVVGVPVEVAAATRPDTILVSNGTHRIEALLADSAVCIGTQQIGIGQMIIGLDFVPIS